MRARLGRSWQWLTRRAWWQKLALLIAVLGVGWWVLSLTIWRPAGVTYEFAQAEERTIAQTVSETGELVTGNQVPVLSTVNGVVSQVKVNNGDTVKRGDQLFLVRSSATDAQRATALAAYQSAKAGVTQAQSSQYSTQAQMFTQWDTYMKKTNEDTFSNTTAAARNLPEFTTTQKEWQSAEAAYQAQSDLIAKAKSSLAKAALDYQATRDGWVTAVADGQVANLAVAPGQQVSDTTVGLVIKTASDNWLKVAINENNITRIKPGQSAAVKFDAIPNKSLKAEVKRVDEVGTAVSDVMLFYVYLVLTDAESNLRPGMTAQIDVTTQEKQNVVAVPNKAIKPYQGEKAVKIWDEATQTTIYQPVKIGIADDSYTEIISGLAKGDQFILAEADPSATTTKSSNSSFMAPSR